MTAAEFVAGEYHIAGMRLAHAVDDQWDVVVGSFNTAPGLVIQRLDEFRTACSAMARELEAET